MKKKRNDTSELVEGSRYHIKSLYTRAETLETKGVFKGYMYIGRDQGVKIELDESHEDCGTVRIIPCHMIIFIDIIDQLEKKVETEIKSSSYFG